MQNGTQKSVEELVSVLNGAEVPGQDVVGEGGTSRRRRAGGGGAGGLLTNLGPAHPTIALPDAPHAEVVVAPTFVHIPYTLANLRKDFAVSAQNSWVKGSGAFTGEIRWVASWVASPTWDCCGWGRADPTTPHSRGCLQR